MFRSKTKLKQMVISYWINFTIQIVDHLQTVSKAKIGYRITSLPKAKMAEVGRAIRFALNI